MRKSMLTKCDVHLGPEQQGPAIMTHRCNGRIAPRVSLHTTVQKSKLVDITSRVLLPTHLQHGSVDRHIEGTLQPCTYRYSTRITFPLFHTTPELPGELRKTPHRSAIDYNSDPNDAHVTSACTVQHISGAERGRGANIISGAGHGRHVALVRISLPTPCTCGTSSARLQTSTVEHGAR